MDVLQHCSFFSATVSNMQAKLENLSATNALTKEDLTICKKALFKSQEENHRLLNQLETVNKELSLRQKRKSGNSEVISSSNSESSNSPSTSGDRTLSKVHVAIYSMFNHVSIIDSWYSWAYLFSYFYFQSSKDSSAREDEERLSDTKEEINSTKDSIISTMKQQLQNEGGKRQELQRELKLQV